MTTGAFDVGTSRFAEAIVTATGGGLAPAAECTWIHGLPFPRFTTRRLKLINFNHHEVYEYARVDPRPVATQIQPRALTFHRALDRSKEVDRQDREADEEGMISGLVTELAVRSPELQVLAPTAWPGIVTEPQFGKAAAHRNGHLPPIMFGLQLAIRTVFATLDTRPRLPAADGGAPAPVPPPRKIKSAHRKLGLRQDGTLKYAQRKKMSELTMGMYLKYNLATDRGARDAIQLLKQAKMDVDDLGDAWCMAAIDAFVESKLAPQAPAADPASLKRPLETVAEEREVKRARLESVIF